MLRLRMKSRAAVSAAALAAAAPIGALAQDDEVGSDFDQIIVTGTASGGVSQFESSIAVTTFDEADIRQSAPLTITDLYAEVPGVWAETSGGESAANIFVRGIPAPGQFRFTKLQVDGLPTVEESGLPFTPPESYIKLDETIARVEAIRGGTATIFSSNAAGGIINNITKKGTQDPEGYVGLEFSDFGRVRVDGFYAGPISDDWTFAAGGFYRTDDGVRDPGFTANDGGQFSVNFTYTPDDVSELNVYGRFLDDRNIFYLPIPLDTDQNDELIGIAGFDPNFDTLTTDDLQLTQIVLPDGVRDRDLSDGIRTQAITVGGSYERELGSGWRLFNTARFLEGETLFNAIFSLTAPSDGQEFIDSRLGQAQAAFAGTDRLVVRFNGDGVGTTSTFDFADGDAGNNGNGLIIESGWWSVQTDVRSFADDFRLTRDFSAYGDHSFTLGLYASLSNYASEWNFNNVVTAVAGSPRGLEIFAIDDDAVGGPQAIGALTQNSFSGFGTFYRNYDADVRVLAAYAADEWQVTDRLRFDAGVRFEQLQIDGQAERLETFDLSDNNPLISTSDLPTTADDAVTFGGGVFDPFDVSYEEFAWAVGLNYELTENIAFYARANDAFRTPDPNDLAAVAADPAQVSEFPVNDIFQAEGGVKLDYPYLRAFITGFFSDFSNSLFSDPTTATDATGNVVELQTLLDSETIGLEAELDIGDFYGFGVNLKATLQDPEITALSVFNVAGINIDDSTIARPDGAVNEVQRSARRIIVAEPRYSFAFGETSGTLFTTIYSVGDRFANPGNTVVLPGYTTLGVGMTLDYRGLEFTFVGDNLTNTIGLTEGNPRVDFGDFGGGESNVSNFGRPIVGRNFRFKIGYRF
ncbi:MAG: TonB-dependent receptor [Parvularculaceae bacterium]